MSNSPATSDFIEMFVKEDDQDDRENAFGLLSEILVYIQHGQPAKARQAFADLRKMNLTHDEAVQLERFINMLPWYERPVYTWSRTNANLFENAFGLNTDAMNAEQFKQFALGVIEGQFESLDNDGRTYAVRLITYLCRDDLFTVEESGELLMKAISETTERMQTVLAPAGIDDDQELLLASIAILGSQLRNPWFMAIVDVVTLCIRNAYYQQDGFTQITPIAWRFQPVLPAALSALHKMFGRDLDFWMRSQDMLYEWKRDLKAGNAAPKVKEAMRQLLPFDFDDLDDLV